MTIERTDKEILIRIPNTVGVEGAQRIIDYINYLVVTSESKATQADAEELADTINQSWWDKHKDTYLK